MGFFEGLGLIINEMGKSSEQREIERLRIERFGLNSTLSGIADTISLIEKRLKELPLVKTNNEKIDYAIKSDLTKLNSDILFIDSNIFMNEKFQSIFQFFSELGLKVTILGTQYDEIYNLKNHKDARKSFLARNSIKVIENLLKSDNLKIEGLTNTPNLNAYADPIFITEIIRHITQSKRVVFITEDADLRIRLITKIKEQGLNNLLLSILSSKDFHFLSKVIELENQLKNDLQSLLNKQIQLQREIKDIREEEEELEEIIAQKKRDASGFSS